MRAPAITQVIQCLRITLISGCFSIPPTAQMTLKASRTGTRKTLDDLKTRFSLVRELQSTRSRNIHTQRRITSDNTTLFADYSGTDVCRILTQQSNATEDQTVFFMLSFGAPRHDLRLDCELVLLILNASPSGELFTEEYFIHNLLANLVREKCEDALHIDVEIVLSIWKIPCIKMVGRSPTKSRMRSLNAFCTHLIR
jgi:hypothetical protein